MKIQVKHSLETDVGSAFKLCTDCYDWDVIGRTLVAHISRAGGRGIARDVASTLQPAAVRLRQHRSTTVPAFQQGDRYVDPGHLLPHFEG